MLAIDGATYLSNSENTSPASEPVTLAEAKAHLRVTHASEDTLISSLIIAARNYVEGLCNRPLITRTYLLKLDRFPGRNEIVLPSGKVSAVSVIRYFDTSNSNITLASTNYVVEGARLPGSVVLAYGISSWPNTRFQPGLASVDITYTAGYANAAAVPQALKQAVLMAVAYWYDVARETGAEVSLAEVPHGVEALARLYSVPRFA